MSTEIQPVSQTDVRALRDCLGAFATGVTVVTCEDGQKQLQGVTANSFSSVSLDPPLVLWNIAKSSDTLEAFLQASSFAINVLGAEQQTLSNHFARSEPDLFEAVPFVHASNRAPLLPGALACLECEQFAVHEAGDHYIIVGKVLGFAHSTGTPLLFWGGGYAALEG